MEVSTAEVEAVAKRLFPAEDIRKTCLEAFVASVNRADMFGAEKWGVYFTDEKIRLLMGNLIVCTAHENALWMALGADNLNESDDRLLSTSEGWEWDTGDYSEFSAVSSRNGYHRPHHSGPDMRQTIESLHFSFIKRVAGKYERLNRGSQKNHDPRVIAYLRHELDRFVPQPEYGDSERQDDNPLRDLRNLQEVADSSRETEHRIVAESRLGQGTFRRRLIQFWGECAVTGCEEISLLKASHIKPWRDSNNSERLDPYNGLLLLPNLDSGFDRGLITFSDGGEVIVSDDIDSENRSILGIHDGLKISEVDHQHIDYLRYHRNHIFESV